MSNASGAVSYILIYSMLWRRREREREHELELLKKRQELMEQLKKLEDQGNKIVELCMSTENEEKRKMCEQIFKSWNQEPRILWVNFV